MGCSFSIAGMSYPDERQAIRIPQSGSVHGIRDPDHSALGSIASDATKLSRSGLQALFEDTLSAADRAAGYAHLGAALHDCKRQFENELSQDLQPSTMQQSQSSPPTQCTATTGCIRDAPPIRKSTGNSRPTLQSGQPRRPGQAANQAGPRRRKTTTRPAESRSDGPAPKRRRLSSDESPR